MTVQEASSFPGIKCATPPVVGKDLQLGHDVILECGRLVIGDGVRIGFSGENDFRLPGGVRIFVDELVLEDGVQIGRQVLIKGGRIHIGARSSIHADTTIHVTQQLTIGSHGTVNEGCEISGVDVVLGRELWMLPQAKIGGGSAFEVHSQLRAGHWCHFGVRSLLNTARPILLGDEVGLGTGTSLYTHGAYPSALEGKPVAFGPIRIGDRSWLPGAVVNPSVTIGKDCVVGVGSVVTRNLPDGCLAAGAPAKVLKENHYPKPLQGPDRVAFYLDLLRTFSEICASGYRVSFESKDDSVRCLFNDILLLFRMKIGSKDLQPYGMHPHVILMTDKITDDLDQVPANCTIIDCRSRRLIGSAVPLTERLLNQLRRYGIRFNYDSVDGHYVPWI